MEYEKDVTGKYSYNDFFFFFKKKKQRKIEVKNFRDKATYFMLNVIWDQESMEGIKLLNQ